MMTRLTRTRCGLTLLAGLGFSFLSATPLAAEQWLRHDTEHFRIIYSETTRATAAELATIAEEVYSSLANYMNVSPERRIPVVLRGETADANGYFTYLPTRIVLYTATPSTPILQPNLDQWLRIVFTHELAHYFHISQRVGVGRLSPLFGPSSELVNLVLTPRWLAEGIAIVTETELTGGGRGRSPVFEMQYVSALLADEFWSLNQNYFGSDFAPRSRVYVGGYVVSEYIIRTYGIDSFMEISREVLRRPLLGIRFAIRRVLDISANDLYDALLSDLEATYGSRREIPGGQRVSPDDGGYWFLVRGSTEVFGASPDRYSRIYPRELWADGIQPGDTRTAIAVSGDAFSLASTERSFLSVQTFADEFEPERFVGYSDLVVIDRATGERRRVTRGRRLYHPVPAGPSSLDRAYAIERTDGYSRLVEVDLVTGDVDPIWKPPRTHLTAPALSPDGEHLAVIAGIDGQQDIYIINLPTGAVRRVTQSDDVPEYFPVFVSATRLWFTAYTGETLALYEIDLETGAVTRRLSDRDGVFFATPYQDGALYQSYSLTGPTVKSTPTLDREPVRWAIDGSLFSAEQTAAAAAREPGDPLSGAERYVDWPLPELWLPFALPASGEPGLGLELDGLALDFGALVVAGSPLEQHLLTLTAAVNSSTLVPSGSLQAMEMFGPWQIGVNVGAAPAYVSDTGAEARYETFASLSFTRSIRSWDSSRLGRPAVSHLLSSSSTVSYSILSSQGVEFSDFLSGPASQVIITTAGIGYSGNLQRRTVDLLGPAGLGASVVGALGFGDGLVQLGALAAASYRAPAAAAMLDSRVSVGIADPAVQIRLGIDSPAWLLDVPIGAFNLTRLGLAAGIIQSVNYTGGSLFTALEAAGSGAAGLQLDAATTATLELVARVGYLATSFAPAVGIAVTVPHAAPSEPTLALTFRNASSDPGIVVGGRSLIHALKSAQPGHLSLADQFRLNPY